MRRIAPAPKKRSQLEVEISNFLGMNNTLHPSLLPLNVLSNLQNSYFDDGVLSKRGGYAKLGDTPTGQHIEEFTSTTKKDAAATTGLWNTSGIASLSDSFGISTNVKLYDATQSYYGPIKTIVSSNGTIVGIYFDGSNTLAVKSTDGGTTWTKLDGTAGTTTLLASTTNRVQAMAIDSNDNIHCALYGWTGSSVTSYLKLSYSAGSWTVGSVVATDGTNYGNPQSIAVDSTGKVWILSIQGEAHYDGFKVSSSTNGTAWSTTRYDMYSTYISYKLTILNDIPYIAYAVGNYDQMEGTYTSGWISVLKWNGSAFAFLNSYNKNGSYGATSFDVCSYGGSIYIGYFNGTNNLCVIPHNGTSFGAESVIISGSYSNPRFSVGSILCLTFGYSTTTTKISKWNGSSWGDPTSSNINVFPTYVSPTIISNIVISNATGSSNPFGQYVATVRMQGVIQSVGFDSMTGSQSYLASIVSTLNGGTIVAEYSDSTDNNTWGAWTADITTLNKRYIRFRFTITGSSAVSPTIDSVTINYSGLSIISKHTWTHTDGSKYFLYVGGTGIYLLVGATWKKIKTVTSNLRTTAASFQSSLLITNGTDPVFRFNGKSTTGTIEVQAGTPTILRGTNTKWKTAGHVNEMNVGAQIKIGANFYIVQTVTSDTQMTMTTSMPTTAAGASYEGYSAPDLVATVGSVPKGKYIVSHRYQVFIAGDPNNPNMIYVSAIRDCTVWSTTQIGDAQAPDATGAGQINDMNSSGQVITGMASFKDMLGVSSSDSGGTRKSWQIITGSGGNFTRKPATTEYAALSQYNIVITPNAIYFLDRTGIVETNLITFRRIDDVDLNETVKTFNQQYLEFSAGAFFNEKLFFSVPTGASVINDKLIMFDLRKRRFGLHKGLNAACFAVYSPNYTPRLYFGDQTAVSSVFQWDSGLNDNGQPIEWIAETGEINFEKYFKNEKLKYLYAFFEPQTSGVVSVYYALNGNTTYTKLSEDISMVSATGQDVFKRWTLPGLKGSSVKFKFYENDKETQVKMVRIGIIAVQKGDRRT